MKLDSIFTKLLQGINLKSSESNSVFSQLFEGKLSSLQSKSLLLLLAQKGECADELLGCLHALQRLEPTKKTSLKLLDTCGTGGDGAHSINISTLAALVIAGAGGQVAKHGNHSISSQCGSSDVLKALGVNLQTSPKKIIQSIKKNGIGYFHAPEHHPVFSRTLNLRRQLKTKTILNLLGPLANPMRLRYRLVGVASKRIFNIYVSLLRKEKGTSLVCYNPKLDEISVDYPTLAALIRNGKATHFTIHPRHLFKHSSGSVIGGDAAQNAKIALRVLRGTDQGKARQTVILNAAAGLWVSGKASSLKQGIEQAENSINSGKALKALHGLIRDSK